MPYIIPGVIAVPVRKAKEHLGHHLTALDKPMPRIFCHDCEVTVEQEYEDHSLFCGCSDQAEHDEGVALQKRLRKQAKVPKGACVGCYLGDDGPSMHDCYVHRA